MMASNNKHYVAVDAPTIHHSRSRFDLSFDVKTSGNVGTLYPIYLQEIYPGDTFDCDTTIVSRLASSYLRPVMDNLFLDVYYFFVPNRLVFDDWGAVFGENKSSAWTPASPVAVPHTTTTSVVSQGSVADYLGLPLADISNNTVLPSGINILPFRAFAKIYDDWFRDENLVAPMLIHTGAFDSSEYFNANAWAPGNYTGMPPKVSKFHDIFTSSLPSTQKGRAAKVPLESYLAPVGFDGMEGLHNISLASTPPQIKFAGETSTTLASRLNLFGDTGVGSGDGRRVLKGITANVTSGTVLSPSEWDLYADLSDAGNISVTSLRYAFQLQRILERSARCGTRYTEYLLSAFGVSSPDARLQRAEYLGGKRMPLSVQQVAQSTRGDTDSTKLGSLGAFSLSNGKCGYQKGFVEHGYVVGVMCLRQHHTYQQGIARMWQRHDRFDYYDPILANISEVPVYKSELFAPQAANATDQGLTGTIFGYQEAWYDLRQRYSMVTGAMRSDNTASYDLWHYADDYANAPTLNQQFVTETPDYVDRTIAVPSTSADQFIFDIYHKQSAVRVLPTYSIPGLVDHH